MGSSKKHKDKDREHKHKHRHKEKKSKHSRAEKEERRARKRAAKAQQNGDSIETEFAEIDYGHGYQAPEGVGATAVEDELAAAPGYDQEVDDDEPIQTKGSGNSLSISETNRLRAKLGLKPLEVDIPGVSKGEDAATGGNRPDVHVPAVNMADTARTEKVKERTDLSRQKRHIEKKLSKIKGLGESESDNDDDAFAWVKKSRIKQQERQLAAMREKILDEMDEEFGLTGLVDEEFKDKPQKSYTARDIQGMTVQHTHDRFQEGSSVILTLDDKGILDEGGDVLINVNMVDDERVDKNKENKRQGPNYNPYDVGDVDEYGELKKPALLSKYDEEIDGIKKDSFKLGNEGDMDRRHDSEMKRIREELQSSRQSLSLTAPQLANEYYTHEEMDAKFKKKKKKVKKKGIREKGILKADDLEPLEDTNEHLHTKIKEEPMDVIPGLNESDVSQPAYYHSYYSQDGGEKWPGQEEQPTVIPPLPEVKTEMDSDSDFGPTEDLSGVVIDDDAESELQSSLAKTRRLKQSVLKKKSDKKVYHDLLRANKLKREALDDDKKNAIVFHSTSEFCRSLGDIPTYGQSGNREDEDDLMDMEDEGNKDDDDDTVTGWNQVDIDTKPVNIEDEDDNVLNDEPIVNKGLSTALSLAVQKGYLEKETTKQISAQQKSKIEVENYSIEDKRYDDLDEKVRKRDRYTYSGAVSDFRDKTGYKPDIKLEYMDDKGNMLNNKEAFRYLSHRFHGKGSGKKKMEKRENKATDDLLLKQMSSIDTPLCTLNLLKEKQKSEKSPFVILTGVSSNKAFMANTITK